MKFLPSMLIICIIQWVHRVCNELRHICYIYTYSGISTEFTQFSHCQEDKLAWSKQYMKVMHTNFKNYIADLADHFRMNKLPHATYWKSLILGMSG